MSVACLEVFGVEEATGIAGVTWWVLDEYFWVALLTSIRVYTTVAVLPVLEKNCENFWSFLVDHRKTRRKKIGRNFDSPSMFISPSVTTCYHIWSNPIWRLSKTAKKGSGWKEHSIKTPNSARRWAINFTAIRHWGTVYRRVWMS